MMFRRIGVSLFVAASMAGSSLAQSAADLISLVPKCALPCVTNAVLTGSCPLTNVTLLSDCLCTNVTLQSSLSTCVQTSCVFSDQVDAGNMRLALCAAYPKESRVFEVRVAAIATLAVSTVIVAMRCAARISITGRLWSDDWTAILATVFLVVGAGLELASAELGFGMHFWDVDVRNATKLLQMFYVVEIIYTWIKLIAKVSIIMLFMRVFTGTGHGNNRWFRWACYACLGYCAISLTTFTFVIAFQCQPVETIWNRFVSGKCIDVNAIGYSGAIMSVVEDLVLMILPISELRKLQIGGRKRIGVRIMFALASFAAVTSMVRLKFLVQFSKTFDTTYPVVWSLIELTCIIVCGSLPPMRPWLGKLMPPLTITKSGVTWKGKSSANDATTNQADSKATEISNFSRPRRISRLGNVGSFPNHYKEPVSPGGDEYPLRPTDPQKMWSQT
ncbi:hypothetical protein JX266_013386 [Neoarthrinium moseri]|nr:hypothetical protein JX266_013386 [Neoarthrinium moseri]